ncbi:MAG: hypothetical protein OHK0029_09820 [Armatimonadaceae bacterium]
MTKIEEPHVWIFNGQGSFPSGAFATRESAEAWIRQHRLTGTLTCYPLGKGIYDWAIELGYFKPKRDGHTTPEFIGAFSSAYQDHYHYENGLEPGAEDSEAE